MAIPPQFQGKSPGQQAADRAGGSRPSKNGDAGANLATDAQSLRNQINRFLNDHGDDRQVSSVVDSLRSVSAELKRVGGDGRDAGPPSPGRQAALRQGSAQPMAKG